MNKLSIDFNAKRQIVHETFDLVELARSPAYAVMLLKTEHTLFNGSKNRSKDFANIITKGFLQNPKILEEFLKKTIGEKNLTKQASIFKAFRQSLNSSYNETRYFGDIIFSEPIASDLRSYLEDPENEEKEQAFILGLSMLIQKSEQSLAEKRIQANQHLASVLEGVR